MKKSSKISDEDKKRFRDAVGNVKPIKNDSQYKYCKQSNINIRHCIIKLKCRNQLKK